MNKVILSNQYKSMREAYCESLLELMKKREDVLVVTADLATVTKIDKIKELFPDRFINVGIAEQNLIGVGSGLSLSGFQPFVTSFAIYCSMKACEQVALSVAYQNLDVKIIGSHAGLSVGENGASHQAISDIAIMRAIPGMIVVVPSDPEETKQAVEAISNMKGPVYLRLSRPNVQILYNSDYRFILGEGVLCSPGKDVTIIATGIMVPIAISAAIELKSEDISARVINIHTIKPIDKEIIIIAAKETGAIVSIEEHNIIGGLGSAIAEVLSENIPVPLERIGINDQFAESGDFLALFDKYNLTTSFLKKAVRKVLKRKL